MDNRLPKGNLTRFCRAMADSNSRAASVAVSPTQANIGALQRSLSSLQQTVNCMARRTSDNERRLA
jgi:hypothetical protein